jgi:tetratricopeptide (TPR) repeat protein
MRPDDDPDRLQLLPLLGRALVDSGGWERAKAVLDEARERGCAMGDRRVVADAVLELSFLAVHTDLGVDFRQVEADLTRAARDFEELGDQVGVARALALAGRLPFWRGDTVASMQQEERAARHARAAGSRAQEIDALSALLFAMVDGPTPVAAIGERLAQVESLTSGSSRADVFVRRMHADVELMLGNVERARAWLAEARALAEELGLAIVVATGIARTYAEIELFAGNLKAAERELTDACDVLRASDDWGHLGSQVPYLMDALFPQGRAEELATLVDEAWEHMTEEDADAQIGMRRARSKLLAFRGDLSGAERLAREALARSSATSYATAHARTCEHLAEILQRMGRDTEAAAARREAVAVYERKGCVAFAERASAALA